MLIIFFTFIVRVILSPLLVVFVTIAYTSIWLPQIVRSACRGRTSGLASEYILGTTVCRLYFLLCKEWLFTLWKVLTHISDFLSCPKNVLEIESRSTTFF